MNNKNFLKFLLVFVNKIKDPVQESVNQNCGSRSEEARQLWIQRIRKAAQICCQVGTGWYQIRHRDYEN
jgi:hypothetical protein